MKKTFIIIFAIVLLAAAIWYYMNPGKNLFEWLGLKKAAAALGIKGASVVPEDISKGTVNNGSFVTAAPIVQDASGFPLMPGSRNSYVKEIQHALNTRFGSELVEDGIYGPKTEKALSAHGFQSTVYWKHYYEILGIA